MTDTHARNIASAALLPAILLVLTACAKTPDTYPISGEPCAPDDPVQTIDVGECTPAR